MQYGRRYRAGDSNKQCRLTTYGWRSGMKLVDRSWVPWDKLAYSPAPRRVSSFRRRAVPSTAGRRSQARRADSRCNLDRSPHTDLVSCVRTELDRSARPRLLSTQHGTPPCHSSRRLYLRAQSTCKRRITEIWLKSIVYYHKHHPHVHSFPRIRAHTRSLAVARIADRTGCQWHWRSSKVDDFHLLLLRISGDQ